MLKDAIIGSSIEATVLLVKKEQKMTRGNKPYLVLTLRDRDMNEVDAKLWNMSTETFLYEKNTLLTCIIKVGEYNSNKDYSLEQYRESIEGEGDIKDYVSAAPFDAEAMYEYILNVAKDIKIQSYRKVIFEIYESNKDKILYWSAAKSVHHNIRSGYLYHTLRMLQSALSLANIYRVNKDLLFAGIILHDIGKLRELCTDALGSAEYSLKGNLLGHLYLGCHMIDEVCRDEEDEEEILLLKHIIASHHGLREWGAIANPQIPEAFLVHYLDKIDADMYQCDKALEQTPYGAFSDKIFGLGTKLYKPISISE